MSKNEVIVAFVAEHPGCTSSEVGAALGGSAAQQIAQLAASGHVRNGKAAPNPLRRERPLPVVGVHTRQPWRYYLAESQ